MFICASRVMIVDEDAGNKRQPGAIGNSHEAMQPKKPLS